MNHFPTHVAHPAQSDLFDQVGAAHDTHQLPLLQHKQALDALIHEDAACFLQVGISSHADDAASHDLPDRVSLASNDIKFGHHPDYRLPIVDYGQATDTMLGQQTSCLLLRLIFGDGNHRGSHNIFDFHCKFHPPDKVPG